MTPAQAYAAIKAKVLAEVEGNFLWPNDDNQLPENPEIFVYSEFIIDSSRVIEIGGGRGHNRHRHTARLDSYVFVPRGTGLSVALTRAELICAALRAYRQADIGCIAATAHAMGDGESMTPPGLSQSEVNNYFCAIAVSEFWFDLTG